MPHPLRVEGLRTSISVTLLHGDFGEAGQGFADFLYGVLVVLEVAGQVALVGPEIKVAVAGEVEDDGLPLS